MYREKLDDIVNKHNNINSSKEINDKDPKFKIGVLLEYQNIKVFLEKTMFQIGLKNFFVIEKVKKNYAVDIYY